MNNRCGNCGWWTVLPEWAKCVDLKPGACGQPLPPFAAHAIGYYFVSTTMWENDGANCPCWKERKEK